MSPRTPTKPKSRDGKPLGNPVRPGLGTTNKFRPEDAPTADDADGAAEDEESRA